MIGKSKRLFFALIILLMAAGILPASSDDHLLIKSDSYSFQILWSFSVEKPEVYDLSLYWPIIDLYSQNWDIFKNKQARDIYRISFADNVFILKTESGSSLKEVFRDKNFKIIIEYLRASLEQKHLLTYTPRSYDRIYKISIPFRQGSDYPNYSAVAIYSQFAFGANTSLQNQYDRGYILIYFDHEKLMKTESVIQRYNYILASRIVTADNIEDFFFTKYGGEGE